MASTMVARREGSIPSIDSHPSIPPRSTGEHLGPSTQTLKRDPDGFLRRSVQDLFSLARRTVAITGGGRGIGLAFAFAVAEAGGNVAILDISEDPHPHFSELIKRFPDQQFKLYKYRVSTQLRSLHTLTK